MGYVQGEGRTQATLFPVILEELIPDDHVCRVIDAFVDRLDMAETKDIAIEIAHFPQIANVENDLGKPGYRGQCLHPSPKKLALKQRGYHK